MSKVLQVLQKKGNNVQGSSEAVEVSGLKDKMKKRRKAKKKDDDFKDEDVSVPANTAGSY